MMIVPGDEVGVQPMFYDLRATTRYGSQQKRGLAVAQAGQVRHH